jgi:sugar O-acyltransferase (sialic acid O-acetyltransferase NeuD family)
MKKIIFIAITSIHKLVLDIIQYDKDFKTKYQIIGFLDDKPGVHGQIISGFPVVGSLNDFEEIANKYGVTDAIICLGYTNMNVRKALFERCSNYFPMMSNFFHPTAVVAHDAAVGNGVILAANVVINPSTSIKDNVIIWPGAIVEHDCFIGEHSYIGPGCRISGCVNIGERCLIGAGAVILPYLHIGNNVIIGAGAVVAKDVPDNAIVYGTAAEIKGYKS